MEDEQATAGDGGRDGGREVRRASALWRRMFREPLVHFLLLGAGLFLVYGLAQKPSVRGDSGAILVTMGQVENLAAGFTRTWQRAPSPGELADLVRDRIREEVYVREAKALGLDQDDTVIRRRLRQKMEFITDDIAAQAEPSAAELAAYFEAHSESFRVEPRFTFSQVYLDPVKRGDSVGAEVEQLLAELERAPEVDPARLGDSLMLEHEFVGVSLGEVANRFGGVFAERLLELEAGVWLGPVESGYGLHLVRLTERIEGRVPELDEVRDSVRRELANARRLESNEMFYRGLLKRYTVTIEGMELQAEGEK